MRSSVHARYATRRADAWARVMETPQRGTGIALGIVVAAGISAGATAYASHEQGVSAEKAAATSAASTDKAIDIQEHARQQARDDEAIRVAKVEADLAPYKAIGTGATSRIRDWMGLAPLPAQLPPATQDLGLGKNTKPEGGVDPQSVTHNLETVTTTALDLANQRRAQLGLPPAGPQPVGQVGSTTPPPPRLQPQGGSSYATMRAPTGETQQVPADQVAHYESRGATRVS